VGKKKIKESKLQTTTMAKCDADGVLIEREKSIYAGVFGN